MATDLSKQVIVLKPAMRQFFINELPLVLLAMAGFVVGLLYLDGWMASVVYIIAWVVSMVLLYRCAYLSSITYSIGDEQLVYTHGLFQRGKDYVELYRVNDYYEHISFLQNLFGVKSVKIHSTDQRTPDLWLIGLPQSLDIVPEIRKRVEYIKSTKRIYETANR